MTNPKHSCVACPREVRDLYATAQNAHGSVTRMMKGAEDESRAKRKLEDLAGSLERMKAIVDVHFEDTPQDPLPRLDPKYKETR